MADKAKASNLNAQEEEALEQKLALDKLLTKLKNNIFICHMTDAQYKEYFSAVEMLEIIIRKIKKDAHKNMPPSEILSYAWLIIDTAYAVGTYKYPDEAGRERSIFGFHSKTRAAEMSADDAAALERNDPQFAKRSGDLKAQGMRDALARRRKPAEEALMEAIRSARGGRSSEHPFSEARQIMDRVNAQLKERKFEAVSEHVIHRRLEKFPRS